MESEGRMRQGQPGRRRWLGPGVMVALFVAAAFLPLIGLHAYSVLQIQTAERLHIEHDVEDLAEAAALVVEGTVDAALSTARALSDVPSIRRPDPPEAARALARILAESPQYVNLWAAGADGRVFATALPGPGSANGPPIFIGDEAYFRSARERLAPVVSSGRDIPGLPGTFAPLVAVPITADSQFAGTVQVAFTFPRLNELPVHTGLPEDTVVTLVDNAGVIIFRSLRPERWVGVSVAGTPAFREVQTATGAFVSPGIDGILRLLAASPVPGTDWLTIVGIPADEALGPLNATLNRELVLFGLTVVLAGVFAWRGKALADQVGNERRRLEGTIDQLPEGVLVVTPTGRVLQANRALAAILGHPVAHGLAFREPLNRAVVWLADEQPVPWEELPFDRARRGEAILGAQLAVLRSDGNRRDLLVNAVPLRDPRGNLEEIVIVLADVTPLKDLDRAKDEFISIAAHELRNPLAGLKGYTGLLLRGAEEKGYDEETLRLLESADRQADRLTELTGRLLDVSRLQLGRLEIVRQPTDLVALAHEVQESLQTTTTRHRIIVDAEPAEIIGNWDADRLRQVLSNLVGNAIKYAPGGLVTILLRREDAQADAFVTDQGPGIPPEQLPHIFERLRQAGRTARERAGGLGLGLYLSRGIIEAHGGRIGVATEPGRGSTFWFTLPLRQGEVSHDPAPDLLRQARAAR